MLYAISRKDRTELLDAHDVTVETGLEYRKALELIKVYGIRLGRRYYITMARLTEALNGKG
ncbi:MAG: hypothetical protein IJ089_03905 [Clostridia bacterium]|nr:hypothetical protein [Clostridia bacterium]